MRRSVLLFGLVLLFPAPAVAQTEDSLIAAMERADKLTDQGNPKEAIKIYKGLLPGAARVWGTQSSNYSAVLNNLALLHTNLAEYDDALKCFEESLAIKEATAGRNDPGVADTLNNMSNLYRMLARYDDSEKAVKRALAIREATSGKNSIDVAESLLSYGNLRLVTGKLDEAEDYFKRSLEIKEAKKGKNHMDTARVLNNLAMVYDKKARYTLAESFYDRSRTIFEDKLGKDHLIVGDSLNHIGTIYWKTGRYADAEAVWKRSLKIKEGKLGGTHPDIADLLHNLGVLYGDMGRYGDAEPLLKRALEIDEAKFGKSHPKVALVLMSTGNLYHFTGRSADAIPLFQRSATIYEAKFGADSVEVAECRHNLGLVHQETGRLDEATGFYTKSLAVLEEKLGKTHPRVAESLDNLANVTRNLGREKEAAALRKRSLEIAEARFGEGSPEAARRRANLAGDLQEAGQYDEAEKLYRRVLPVQEAHLGKDHPDVAAIYYNLGRLNASRGDAERAFDSFDVHRRFTRRHVAHVLPTLAERDQAEFLLYKDLPMLVVARAFAVGQPKLAERTAAWILNSKGVGFEAQALATRGRDDADIGDDVRELLNIRRNLARMATAKVEPAAAEEFHKNQEELAKRERELSVALQKKGAIGQALAGDPWVEQEAIRKALPPGGVFVDFAEYVAFDFKQVKMTQRAGSARYAAWITPKTGPIRVVDLGTAKDIEAAIAAARKAIEDGPARVKAIGEEKAEAEAKTALAAAGKLILTPLRAELDKATHWVLSPDSELWLLPWAALPVSDKEYAIEKHTIQLVITGRDLLAKPRTAPASPSAIFADPDFDAGANQGLASLLPGKDCAGKIGTREVIFKFTDFDVSIRNTDGEKTGEGEWSLEGGKLVIKTKFSQYSGTQKGNKIVGERTRKNEEGVTETDTWEVTVPAAGGRSLPAGLGKAPRLAGTAAEAEASADKFAALFGKKPEVFTEKNATVAALQMVKGPAALLLATHGYFLSVDRSLEPPTVGPRKAAADPLVRSGLLLTGANAGTGIVTARELLSLDLRGTKVVILSACQTGLGEVQSGEGVAGLRQTFQLAGAESVVATLWKVPDLEAALTTVGFLESLEKGDGQADALKAIQAKLIQQRRDRFQAAHPYYWAAHTITGSAGPVK
jgi:tetratricopeptide (TPR) repeat protein